METAKFMGNAAGNMPAVNPLNYPSEVCPKCGCEIFVPGIIFKKVPGVLIGQGADDTEFPIKIFYCANCRELSPYDKKILEKGKKNCEETKESKKSNLII